MRGPFLKSQGSFQILKWIVGGCRVHRLLRRIDARPSILAGGVLFGFARGCGLGFFRLVQIVSALSLALVGSALLPHPRLNFVD